MLKGILTVNPFWVNHRICQRNMIPLFLPHQFIWHFMMVCHYDLHTQLLSIPNFPICCYAVITGDNQLYPIFMSFFNQSLIDTITVYNSVRYVKIYNSTQGFQSVRQNIPRSYPVNIIITDDPDFFPFMNRSFYDSDRLVHILHQQRRMQLFHITSQIFPVFLLRDNFSVPDNPCNYRVNREFFS